MKAAVLLAAAPALLIAATPKQVSIVKPEFYEYEGSPPGPPRSPYLAGETIFFGFQVAGFQAGEDGKVSLTWSAVATDPQAVKLAPPQAGKVTEELSPEDKAWLPKIRLSFPIPPSVPSGTCRFALAVKDELNGSEAKSEVTFEVRGRRVEPSSTLVIRNFRFLRSDEDRQPMARAAYHPGEAIWARFEITGYKFGDGNRIDVEYGIAVLRPTGEVLYSEPKAAADKDQTFYPKRWVEGILNLKLDPDVAKGEYVIAVTARDGVGGQTCEDKHSLLVE